MEKVFEITTISTAAIEDTAKVLEQAQTADALLARLAEMVAEMVGDKRGRK